MSITQLDPQIVWHYFHQLTQIPRPSFHETAVQQYILDEAARLGLHAERDEAGNVLVRKPATQSMENRKGVILQGHLDMVAQKNQDSDHDFQTDPIQAYVDGEWVRARGTTLGADNGIGVAAALAVLASKDIAHGNIEALFTATEETGMDGAKGLQGGWLQGDILLNLDSETLGEICIGCAGGLDGTFELPLHIETAPQGKAYQLSISGLKGGHSGIDIIKQRGNAIKILATILHQFSGSLKIATMQGGTLRNAIPREAQAVFVSNESETELAQKIAAFSESIRQMLSKDEQAFSVVLRATDMPAQCWNSTTQSTVLRVLTVLPNGVDGMNNDVAGLVETSTNLAKIETLSDSNSGCLKIECLLRSQNEFARDNLAQRMVSLIELAGGKAELSGAYPGWRPVVGADITNTLVREGEKLLGKQPEITVIHAGLECGILSTHYPHWQMASFGPTIEMPHSPDERVHIGSVGVFWTWLKNVLANID
ncbi:aminoacyl-histidine dipeptidase [Neisseriaceae bacterium B1]